MTFGPPRQIKRYHGRSFSPARIGLEHYSDSEPDVFFRRRASSVDHFTNSFVPRLQDPNLKCDRNLGWNIDWAVAFIVDHIEKKSDAAETLRNIRFKAATLEREGLVEDIPFRIFNKLDETLFAGHLKNAVFLEISRLSPEISGATYAHGWGPITDVKRVSIILNSDVLEHARAREVVAILIHHMIHAYFLIACGPQKEDEVDYGRLSHGQHFGKILSTVRELSSTVGHALPLTFGLRLDSMGYYMEESYRARRRPSRDMNERDKWYCSHCYSDVPSILDTDLDKWYDKTCLPMHDHASKLIRHPTVQTYNDRRHELEQKPRARLLPSIKTVEFLLTNTPTLIETKFLDENPSIKHAFDKSKSRFLTLTKQTTHSTFLLFLEYLHIGTYRPDPTLDTSITPRSHNAPIIKPTSTSSLSAPILSDIRIVHFAHAMTFHELTSYALSRLDTYPTCTEDPVAILSEIYTPHGTSGLDKRLKDWARRFLGAAGHGEPPNVVKLLGGYAWSARLRGAMEENGGLENEVGKVVRGLCVTGEGGSGMGFEGMMGMRGLEMGGQGILTNTNTYTTPAQPLPLTIGYTPQGIQSPFQLPNFQNHQQHQHLLLGTTPNIAIPPFSTTNPSAHALHHLTHIHQSKLRDLEREKAELAREKERLREVQAQFEAAAALEAVYGRGAGGFVMDDGEGMGL